MEKVIEDLSVSDRTCTNVMYNCSKCKVQAHVKSRVK